MTLTREMLESGILAQVLQSPELRLLVLSEAQLQASIDETLQQYTPSSDIWVFAYGSLIWNPLIKFVERRIGTVEGWHRQFCLWTPVGRGTPEHPGLVLGLEHGGSCGGVVYQIAAADVPAELSLLWRREMIASAYIPHWVKVMTSAGEVEAIAFTINHHHPMYAANLPEEVVINRIATAGGPLGACADYLAQTITGLQAVGIDDQHLSHLHAQVQAVQAGEQVSWEEKQ